MITWTSPTRAELISSLEANFGYTSLSVDAGAGSTTISAPTAVEVDYALHHPTLSTAYVLSFYELLQAGGVKIPYSQISFGVRYYPMGFNGSRMILDQGVAAKVWKATPFLGLSMGLANLTTEHLNASMIEMSPRAGVELPIAVNTLLQSQMILHSAGGGSGSADGGVTISPKYTGLTILAGVIFLGL